MIETSFVNYNSFFEYQFQIFKFVGIRFDLSVPRKDTLTEYLATVFYRAFCYIVYALHSLCCIFYVVSTDDSLDKRLAIFSNTVAHATAFTKFYAISTNLDNIENILKELEKLYNQKRLDQMMEPKNLIRNATFVRRSAQFFMVMTPVILAIPCVMTYAKYWVIGKWEPRFPTDIWCPFEVDDYYLPFYFLVYYAGVVMGFNILAGDCLFYMILMHITQQMKELTRDFNGLKMHGVKIVPLIDRQVALLR